MELALRFILHTNRSVFLTGKAGTGKTSFLKTIREQCGKKMAVVAPTGVAAINAGGVTIHTFFQLPLGAFVPMGSIPDAGEQLFNNKASLLRNLRFSQPKKELFQELELLVIDEVSMVRADVMDAIDAVLRFIRKKPQQLFGGVQILFIGDLLQLAPVVSEREWVFLKEHYASPFFFDSCAIREAPPFLIELKKIYRQTDEGFIDLLNKVRNNQLDQIGWHQLHEHFRPTFESTTEDRYITLSTHNNRADAINQLELSRLTGPVFRYEAEITGDFGEKSFPAEEVMELKVGAQIMFIKNDKGEFRRYYNGKIGVIDILDEEGIQVVFPGEEQPLLLEKETWRNIRYKLDKAKDKIEEEELGTFSQFPIRLAWAITIHKSQGLTFEKAVIDAGAAFAPGQVYVALSRLTGLNGLVLKTRIPFSAIQTDQRVLDYTSVEISEADLEEALTVAEKSYVLDYFIQCFRLDGLESISNDWRQEIEKKTSVSKSLMLDAIERFQHKVIQLQQVATKTSQHFNHLVQQPLNSNATYLLKRNTDALVYFRGLFEELDKLLDDHAELMKKEARLTKYQRELAALRQAILLRKGKMEQTISIAEALCKDTPISEISLLIQQMNRLNLQQEEIREPKAVKKEVGASLNESLQMCRDGFSIKEIASTRSLALSTIEGHLITGIGRGELEADYLVSATTREQVIKTIERLGSSQLGLLKESLGERVSYTEIKAALAYHRLSLEQGAKSD